jgi:site-specific recombinase XerC
MPLPSGLTFEDRIAEHSSGYFFLCQRKGHAKVTKRFDHESDANEFRSAHDTAFHNATFRHIGFQPQADVNIAAALEDWKRHVGELEVDGIRSSETTQFYAYICEHLKNACREVGARTSRDLTPQRISQLVRWFRKHTESEGAATIKALSALKTVVKWKGGTAEWKIPRDEIRAPKKEKRDLDAATIRRLISGMKPGSLEEAVTWLKARTGVRDVEIRDARPEEFDLNVEVKIGETTMRVGIFAPMLHSKRKQKRHVYVLTSDTVDRVRPFVEKAKKGQPVFTIEGRKMQEGSLRRRFVRASENAKDEGGNPAPIDPPIESIAPIRAEVVTQIVDAGSAKDAQKFIGHDSESTTLRWYYKDKMTMQKIAQLSRTSEIVAKAIPLRAGV